MPKTAHLQPIPQVPPPRDAAEDARKNALLRKVSHELRTPLNSILGFSEVLTSELYGRLGAPQYKEYAQIIRRSGQKLLKLVNQVMELARLEVHFVEIEAQPEALDSALENVLGGLREDVASHRVRVRIAKQGHLPMVLADAHGLRTVLFNLLHNAITFSTEGGEVRIRAERHLGAVEIVVADQGEGL